MKISKMCVPAAVFATLLAGGWGRAGETELPLTKVTAFSSGVAYYERNGAVNDDAEVLLFFKAEQINDVLKSLVMMDLKGGEIGGANYASQEPLERALKNFGVDLSGEPTLGQILRQLRGAGVVVSTPEKISGEILGVETRTEQILPSNTIVQKEVLNLLTAEGVKAVGLDTISAIAPADDKLSAELKKALVFLVESRDKNRQPVRLSFRGKGERAVRVGYITEAPVWKTSYRLVLGGEEKDKALLQGWAIVENTGDSDWKHVELTLVSGRPISFIQDLYTPLYAQRPVVESELYASLRPQVYGEGIAPGAGLWAIRDEEKTAARRPAKSAAPASPREEAESAMRGAYHSYGMAQDMESVKAAASGAAVGELFSYRVSSPVSLPRSTSAMLPIINQTVAARKVAIYNTAVLADHPLNGVWLTNDTGLSLLAGPVTVFDGGTYAGDARIDSLPPKDKRLLSYAVDLKMKVDSTQKSSERIVSAKISRGVMIVGRRHEYKQEYVLKNKADGERAVVIEHPRRTDLKLLQPAEPLEKTESLYRFEVAVKGSGTVTFEVLEERTYSQSILILPEVDSLLGYSRQGEIPAKVRDALTEVVKRKTVLSQAERELAELEGQVKNLRGEQEQVRANMKAVTGGSQAYARFEKKLLELETQIETLQEQTTGKRGEVEQARKNLADYIGGLNVE